MQTYHQPYWGYQLEYPNDWVHKTLGDTEAFAPIPEALAPGYEGPDSGHLLLRAEWNPTRQPVEDLWKEHITKAAGMIGAKQVGSAPWAMGGGQGFEAELVLSKQDPHRLWVGILEADFTVLHLMVSHHKNEKETFEPVVTQVIKSLRFNVATSGLETLAGGFPIPPGYHPIEPEEVLTNISEEGAWEAYSGEATTDALQAFYLRESAGRDWEAEEYIPFPNTHHHNFARLRFRNGDDTLTLAILPYPAGDERVANTGKIIIRK